MTFPDTTLGILVIVALSGVAIFGAISVYLLVRLRRLQDAYAAAIDPRRREDVFGALKRHQDDVESMRNDVAIVHKNSETLRDLIRGTTSRVGIVRYDAFDDMGGQLSFSVAMLDERGDGVVLSAINGRSETRTYAKPVKGKASDHNLSPEEVAAIDAAITGEKGVASPAPPHRRDRDNG